MNRRDFLRGAAVALAGAAAAVVVGMQPAPSRPIATELFLTDPPFMLADGVLYKLQARARNLITPMGITVEIWYDWEPILDGLA